MCFKPGPRNGMSAQHAHVEHHALELVEDMNEADFLNFTTGFQDAVNQILEPLDCWTKECQQGPIWH
jgi:hypothetical protein